MKTATLTVNPPVSPQATPQVLDTTAQDETQPASMLLGMVYDELRRLARAKVARVGPMETLTPTELVHEAYVRLTEGRRTSFEGRRHFFFAADRAMRDILVEKARQKASLKRGRGTVKVTLDGFEIAAPAPRDQVLDLNRALAKLEQASPECAQVVMLSYCGGLTHPEIGEVLGISRATVERRWAHARAWLRQELSGDKGPVA